MSCSNDECVTVSTASSVPLEKTNLSTGSVSKHFQQAAFLTVEKYISKIRLSQFKEKYPELYKHDPGCLRNVYMQLKLQLQDKIEVDLENYFKNTNLFEKLQKFEEFIKDADKSDSPAWRPSGEPNEDIRDHRCEEKRKHKRALEIILKSFKKKVQLLENKVDENHEEILKLKKVIDEIYQQNNKGLELITNNMPKTQKLNFIADEKC